MWYRLLETYDSVLSVTLVGDDAVDSMSGSVSC